MRSAHLLVLIGMLGQAVPAQAAVDVQHCRPAGWLLHRASERERGRDRHDCLTPKGFSYTRQALASGVEIDVYDVHLDAGGNEGDRRARETQIGQLIAAIAERSKDRALLLAGDTNIRGAQGELLQQLEQDAGLTDVCKAVHCPEPQRIDRIYVRSSSQLSWRPRKWTLDRRFVDARGEPLSDHLAVAAELDWSSAT